MAKLFTCRGCGRKVRDHRFGICFNCPGKGGKVAKKTMKFLINAPKKARRRKPARGSRAHLESILHAAGRIGPAASSRKRRKATKRKPPKGFSTWSAYMASIRPTSGSTKTMAAKRKRRKGRKTVARRRSVTRTNPVRARRRSRYRRNPMGLSVGGIKNIILGGVVDAAFGVGGKTAVRVVRSKLGFDGATTVGAAVEVATATAIGLLSAKMLGASQARAIVQGAFMSPIENFLKAANLPFVSSALGDEGDFAGIEDGMGGYPTVTGGAPVAAIPSRAGGLGGYPHGLGDEEVGDSVYGY